MKRTPEIFRQTSLKISSKCCQLVLTELEYLLKTCHESIHQNAKRS